MSTYTFEIWKNIPLFEGKYQASSFGRIKSLKRKTENSKCLNDKILKQIIYGLRGTDLYAVVDSKNRRVARLVCTAFNGLSEKQVNHKDGNPKNNFINNLEFVTAKENVRHAIASGLAFRGGEKNPNSKYTNDQVAIIRDLLQKGYKQVEISKITNIPVETISHIKTRRTWNK